MKDRNLWLAVGNLLAAEEHLAEEGLFELLDDVRYIRQELVRPTVRNEEYWCSLKHCLSSYVNTIELMSKFVRQKRDVSELHRVLRHLDKIISKLVDGAQRGKKEGVR